MTSEKQIQANQRNAAKSTGPITEEGKNAVRLNALKHGMTSQQPLLPGENPEELQFLAQALTDELKPQGRLEEVLVERIILLSWRLQRLSKTEMGLFVQLFCEQILSHEISKADKRPSVTFDGRTRTTITHRVDAEQREAILESITDPQTKARIAQAQEKMDSDAALMGSAFRRDVQRKDVLSKLLRYETTLEKSLFRAIHELQRLQDKRAGKQVPTPAVLDIN